MNDPDVTQKIDYAHAIMQFFRYNYKNQWVSQKILQGRNRLWQQAFNDLVAKGFIEKKKTFYGYKFKWIAPFPY